MLPILAVTSGEPAGIGPELCLRLIPLLHLVVNDILNTNTQQKILLTTL